MTLKDKTVIVVGGGLAGLATATYVARAGRPVTLLERGATLGGRAATRTTEGFFFNLGPHALYADGAGRSVLDELEVPISGHGPPERGRWALFRGRRYLLPSGPASLLGTKLLPWRDKVEVFKLLAKLRGPDTRRLTSSMSLREWLDTTFRRERARLFVEALFRLTTYTHAPEQTDAEAALRQLQLASRGNVLYLDGGWQSLVDGLADVSSRAGARIRTASPVAHVSSDGVTLRDGTKLEAASVVLAVGPQELARLTGMDVEAEPVRAACLDVALTRLPDPGTLFVLGIDRPLYFSVHSKTARLAPVGGALIHAVRYLGPDETAEAAPPDELETFLDDVQPGWRDVLVKKRFLPRMTVSHAVIPPGGRRTDIDMLEAKNVFVAGEWVGPEGMLADAALSSARRVAARLGAIESSRAA